MRLILINQALHHPKMRFSGSRRTEFLFLLPSPPNGAENGFFHLVSPAGHFGHGAPSNLRVLNSIVSLIFINQALDHPRMYFSGSRPTNFPFTTLPQTVPKVGFFTS